MPACCTSSALTPTLPHLPHLQLLLPEDFSLARPAAEAREAGRAGPGPLGLQLTISPQLLADINACLPGSRGGAPLAPPVAMVAGAATA